MATINHLSCWAHPGSAQIRLYVPTPMVAEILQIDGKAPQAKNVKAWFEKLEGETNKTWTFKHNDPHRHMSAAAFMHQVMERLGVDPECGWEELYACTSGKGGGPRGNKARPNKSASTPKQQSSALDVASIRMPSAITIEVDHREPILIPSILDKHEQIQIKRVALELADFRVTDRQGNELLIERKRCNGGEGTDFESSIIDDGRLFDQSERLKFIASNSDHQVIPIILLEGDLYGEAQRMLCQQIDGAISFLAAVQRVNVMVSVNANHSAYMVAKLASHFIDGLYEPVSMHRQKPKALFEQKRYVLEALPGISTGVAEKLLETFGSIEAVANATNEQLMQVHGMGKKRVAELRRVLS